MRAILLAAGLGTRLRPLTNTVPKCLVPIRGEPLLGIWLRRLTHAGIGPFLVNTHYLPDRVREFVAASPFQDQVTLAHEETLLGTAGTLLANLDFFQGQDGLLIHADNFCLADFTAFAAAHASRPQGCALTVMTFQTTTPSTCGIVELDEHGLITGFHEKAANPPGNLANGAVYILSPAFQEAIRRDFFQAADFSTEVLPHFLGRAAAHETKAPFVDVGTPEAYALAQEMALKQGELI